MHSFSTVSALLAATFATVASAAPITVGSVSLPANGQVAGLTNLVNGATGTVGLNGEVTTLEGDVNTLGNGLSLRDVASTVESAVKAIDSLATRQTVSVSASGSSVTTATGVMSVAAIFNTVQTQITPLAAELTYLTPTNCTVASVTNIVNQMKAPIAAAVPQLQALNGQPLNVIMGAIDGSSSVLSLSQVGAVVSPVFMTVFSAVSSVVNVAGAQAGATTALAPLTSVAQTLLSVAVPLVGGLLGEVSPMVAPVVQTLNGTGLLNILGLSGVAGLLGVTGLSL